MTESQIQWRQSKSGRASRKASQQRWLLKIKRCSTKVSLAGNANGKNNRIENLMKHIRREPKLTCARRKEILSEFSLDKRFMQSFDDVDGDKLIEYKSSERDPLTFVFHTGTPNEEPLAKLLGDRYIIEIVYFNKANGELLGKRIMTGTQFIAMAKLRITYQITYDQGALDAAAPYIPA